MERRPGKQGLVVALVDVSASMTDFNKMVADELALVARKIRLRVFAFAGSVKEVHPHGLHEADVGYWTNMLLGMQVISALNPERTLIMSDGETGDGMEILHIANQMTGRIDAFYCAESRDIAMDPALRSPVAYAQLMQDLARYGQGRMAILDISRPSRSQLREELSRSFFQPRHTHGGNMKRYPDQHIQGDQIDFRQPPRKRIDMTQHIDVHHQTVINHIRHAPQQIEHGTAGQQTTYVHGAQITMHQPPAERQIADRGHVVEVRHQHAALPKPGIRLPGTRPHPQQLALPAPTRALNGRSLDPRRLPAPEQQPMQPVSARARVLAVLNGAKR